MAPEFSQDDLDADHLRSEVLAVLSHELSTPLAAIKGYVTAMLLEEVSWPEEKRRQFLQLITDEVDNLKTMISEILDTTRMESGLLAIEPQPLRLPRLAQEVAAAKEKRWLEENAAALDAANAYVEARGIPLARHRKF